MPSLNRDPPNSTGYYVEPPNAHRLPITRLGHISAHIYSLRIINHRRPNIPMAEQFLDRPNVVPIFKQMCGEAVALMPRAA